MSKRYRNIIIILWIVALLSGMCAAYISFVDRGYTEVFFLDVGQGDSCFIKDERGNSVLIDGGDVGSGKYVLTPFLQKQSVHKLNAVFISHLHSDHASGIYELIESGFPIERIYISDKAKNDEGYGELTESASDKAIPVEVLSTGSRINVGKLSFNVIISGCTDCSSSDTNDTSSIIRMDYGDNSFLFTGDATQHLENHVLSNPDIDTDFLKVGHHGSNTSSGMSFISKVTPELAVISVAENNKYRHPSEETLRTFDIFKVPVMRTDMHGTISITMTEDDLLNVHGSRTAK